MRLPGLGSFPQILCHCVPTDPMNALQSLTGGPTPGAAGIGMPPRGPGQSLGGMGGLGAMGQPMPLSGQPPPGTSGMTPHGMAVVSTATPQSEYCAHWQVTLHANLVLTVLLGKVPRSPRELCCGQWGSRGSL